MDAISFLFRNKLHHCNAFVEDSEQPCFVFVILRDKELVDEFGEDIAIKTDLVGLLPRKDDSPALLELREAIFAAVKNMPAFQKAKSKWQQDVKPS